MRVIQAAENYSNEFSSDRSRAEVKEARAYANHVLSQRRRAADHASAHHLKEMASEQERWLAKHPEGVAMVGRYHTSELGYHLALLRGRAPLPRPLSLVKADPMALSPENRGEPSDDDAFRASEHLLFLGEHPNMRGHGAVQDTRTGRLFVGVHLNELMELENEHDDLLSTSNMVPDSDEL